MLRSPYQRIQDVFYSCASLCVAVTDAPHGIATHCQLKAASVDSETWAVVLEFFDKATSTTAVLLSTVKIVLQVLHWQVRTIPVIPLATNSTPTVVLRRVPVQTRTVT